VSELTRREVQSPKPHGGFLPTVDHSSLSPSELFSACARGGDAASWEEFIRRFNPVIARSALRVAMRHGTSESSLIDDLVQETYLKICANECKLLRTFIPQQSDSTFAFLKVVASSVAQDYFKARLAEKRGPQAKAETLDEVSGRAAERPQAALTRAERAILIDQIDRKLVAVLPPGEIQRARVVFWLYYRTGFTASAIASLPAVGLTTKGVESLLFRLTRLVRASLSDIAAPDTSSGKGFRRAESF
jgi:RNA polymerase sigma-70 factor (ECF subfamily)